MCFLKKNAQSKGRIIRIWKNFGYASASQCSIDDIPTKQTSLSDRLIILYFCIFDLMYNSAYSYPPEQCVLLPYMQFAHKTTPKRCAKLRKQNIALHSISPDNLTSFPQQSRKCTLSQLPSIKIIVPYHNNIITLENNIHRLKLNSVAAQRPRSVGDMHALAASCHFMNSTNPRC